MVLHSHRIIYGTFIRARATLELARLVGKTENWSGPWQGDPRLIAELVENIHNVLQQKPVQLASEKRNRPIQIMASDASGERGAYLQLLEQGAEGEACEASEPVTFQLPKELGIFVKEVIAARRAITSCAKQYPGSLIRLLEDNSAAAIVINRGWSSVPQVCDEIDRIYRSLKTHDCRVEVLTIPGKVNPADEPSRQKSVADWKLAYHAHLFQAPEYSFVVTHDRYEGSNRVRHPDEDL